MQTTQAGSHYHLMKVAEGLVLWLGKRDNGEFYWKPSREQAVVVPGGPDLDASLRDRPDMTAVALETAPVPRSVPLSHSAEDLVQAEAVLKVHLPTAAGAQVEVSLDEEIAKRLTVLFAHTWGWVHPPQE